jgi:hypothetical protein
MVFKNSFFSIKGAMSNISMKAEVKKSIRELHINLQQKSNNLQDVKAESNDIIQECLQMRRAIGLQQLKRDRSDVVYRAYFQEGGIYCLLHEIVEYAEYRLDDFNDVNTLFFSIQNGKIDMISYHINKMKKKLGELDEEIKRLEVSISSEKDEICSNDRDIFLKEIGWEDVTVKINKLNEGLAQIIAEFEDAAEEDISILKQKLLLISNELDEINLRKGIEKLRIARQALMRDQNHEVVEDYGLLLEKLETVFNDEKLKQLSIVEAVEFDEYKEKLRVAADFIQQELLDIWNRNYRNK